MKAREIREMVRAKNGSSAASLTPACGTRPDGKVGSLDANVIYVPAHS
jgi:hypothetical protein